MTKSEIVAVYENRKSGFAKKFKTLSEQINLISNLRLAAVLVLLIAFYFSLQNAELFVLPGLFLILFLYLIKHHAGLFSEKELHEHLIFVNETELRSLGGDPRNLDPGTGYIDPAHPYTHDLDIFGDGSLYQYINRGNTIRGRSKLARHLSEPLHSREVIVSYQEAIRDMATRIDFRQNFQASGMKTDEQPGDMDQLIAWLKHPDVFPLRNKIMVAALYVVPVMTILALIGTFFFAEARVILFPLILTQWIFFAVYAKRVSLFHDFISRKKNILQRYSRLLFYLANEQFQSAKLQKLSVDAKEAHDQVRRLASLVNALDARTNAMAIFFINSFLLYDLQCVYRLEKWKSENGSHLPLWLDAITEAELIISFGTYSYNHPDFCYAEISKELSIETKNMAHPLIDPGERISNDYGIGPAPAIHIITGANMAGKSTFLRTLGVNLVLALNGAPVCASSFRCSLVNLRSGMRTADSLKDHQSYFFAELNRLKSIMDELRSDKPLLILLDEILKGTNSNDKQAGSIALVKQLLPHPCLALIATHDLALGQMQDQYPDKITNYCFEATIEGDVLSFDYKLKSGIAQKMNASFLMQKMGIIPAGDQT
jgi:hypothetical protein